MQRMPEGTSARLSEASGYGSRAHSNREGAVPEAVFSHVEGDGSRFDPLDFLQEGGGRVDSFIV